MKILFLTQHKLPHIGGVEKHIGEVQRKLKSKSYNIQTISREDINYPKTKIFGLFYIWIWLFKNRDIISSSEIVHIHDVFIWYLPFIFLYPSKKVYMTFHGWEGKYPIPIWNLLNKIIAQRLTKGNIAVGKYIDKYYKIKSDYIIYGGVSNKKINRSKKIKNSILYLGRLDEDTGIPLFLKWLDSNSKKYNVTFVGDGEYRKECKKYGTAVGNVKDLSKYLKTSEYAVPSGYLSFLEAKSFNCKIMTFADNSLKEDYWREIKLLKDIPTWKEISDVYIKLWDK